MTDAVPGTIQGRIEPERPIQTHLARAFLPLVRGKRTGALQLAVTTPRTVRVQIVIVEGQIAFAESDADASALLERLIDLGGLDASHAIDIERAILDQRGWSGLVKASELAVSEGQVRPDLALSAISEVVRARVGWSLRQPEGDWVYRDDPRAAAVPRYPVPFEKTVIETLAHEDVAPRFEAALTRYAQHYPRLEGESNENTTLFGMTPARFRTLRLLDGTHTLAEVLATSPMGAPEAAALVAGLTIFERIWWNTGPTPRTTTGHGTQRAAPPRQLTMERPPTAIEELRALEQSRPVTPAPAARPITMARPPTPAPTSSPGGAPSPASIAELLRRGGQRITSREGSTGPAPTSQVDALSARGYFDRGRTHLAAGRIAAANIDLSRALELEPGDRTFLLHARFATYLQASAGPGRQALEKELHELATSRVKEVEHDAFAYHVLGRLAFDQGDDDRARKAFKAASRHEPNDVETLRFLRILANRAKK